MRDGVLVEGRSFFDFGCGHGQDLEYLVSMGFRATGWDPVHAPDIAKSLADVVNLGYVVNVIEDPAERAAAVREALGLAQKVLVVSAMVGFRDRALKDTEQFNDGVLTRRGTFQKYFEQAEFHEYISATTQRQVYTAGLGVVYVFADEKAEEAYCASVARESTDHESAPNIGSVRVCKDHLEAIAMWACLNGRLPGAQELPECSIAIGLLESSDDWIGRLSGLLNDEDTRRLRRQRRQSILEKLCAALYSPRGGLRMSDLPFGERADVRSVFGSMERANRQAELTLKGLMDSNFIERLCREWQAGKLTPNSLYFHRSLFEKLPMELRIFVACAQEIAASAGAADANVVKINFKQVGVSFLVYPSFEERPHPGLAKATRIDFETSSFASRSYEGWPSVPILHRKELLVSDDHDGYARWASLTRQEESLELLGRRDIGTEAAWGKLLATKGIRVEGYTLSVGDPYDFLGASDEPSSLTEEDDFEVPTARLARGAEKQPRLPRASWSDSDRQVLLDAVHRLGRAPVSGEVNVDICALRRFSKLENWATLFGQQFCQDTFEAARLERWRYWIILLAAARFTAAGRPKIRELDQFAQADLNHLFSSYRQACAEADRWLLKIGDPDEIARAIASWSQGLQDPEKGVYLHVSLLAKLPVVLRLVVMCAEYMAGREMPEQLTVIRIAPGGENVKFYQYEDFERVGPARRIASTKVDFRKRRVVYRDRFSPARQLWSRHEMLDQADPLSFTLRELDTLRSNTAGLEGSV